MKRFKSSFFKTLFILLSFLSFSNNLKAQIVKDIVFNYGTPSPGCLVCGDGYDCFTTKGNGFVDTTAGGLRLNGLKVYIYYTSCSSAPTFIILNGDTIGVVSRAYGCACGSCFVDSITVPPGKLAAFHLNAGNGLLLSCGGTQCVDRVVVRKFLGSSAPLDAAVQSIDSPFYACPGVPKSIKATIANFGTTRIDSVEVHWTYNGTSQTMYHHKSTIDTIGGSGSYRVQLTLGTKTLTPGKYDTLVVWTKNPNGTADTVTVNDTMVAYLKGALSDTFTVGGTSPDYTTLQDAINDLMANGMCGPVVLNLRNGTYNEQVTVGTIFGSSSTNTLTIRSESGDSSAVVVNYSSSSSAANYVMRLTKTSNVIFSRISIEALSSSYGRGLYLTGSNSIQLKNCRLMGPYYAYGTTLLTSLYSDNSSGAPTNNVTIANCQFDGNSFGIYVEGSGGVRNNGLTIVNSVFQDQYYNNVYSEYTDNINISGSLFERNTSSDAYGYGIQIYDLSRGLNISRNKIIQRNGGNGLYLSSSMGADTAKGKIYNNFVSSTNSSFYTCQAMYFSGCAWIDVFYNSLYVKSSTTSSRSAYLSYGNDIRFFNNALMNEGAGPVIYHDGGTTFSKCDRNTYFAAGTPFGYYNSSSIASFNSWKNTTKLDSHSYNSNPNYLTPSDLHAYSVDLNAHAETYAGVTTDIDGQTRHSVNPDIGADEFDLAPDDAGLAEFGILAKGTSCVNVVLKNFGNDTLKTVSIHWQIDGVTKTTYSWTGNLGAGDTDLVCLGTHFIKYDSFYNIKAWTSNPNSKSDTINYNDTLDQLLYPALSGVYTIGGTTPDFATFKDAVDAMINGGIVDSVRFRVRSGTYNELLEIPEIEGVEDRNDIVFESESLDSTSVIIAFSGSYVVYLNGADGVTFRYLTIKNTATFDFQAVHFENGATNNMLFHNVLQASASTYTSSYYSVVYSYYSGDHDNSFIGNRILNGGTGIYLNQNGNALIQDNIFSNQYARGLYIDNCMDAIISGNRVESNSNYDGYYGMYIYYLYGRNYIFDNKINGPGKKEYAGLYIYSLSTNSGDSSWIYNNFISSGRSVSGTSYAFFIDESYQTLIAFNNVHNFGIDSVYGFALYVEDGDRLRLLNNNIINSGGGYPYYSPYTYVVDQSDYNNFYGTGTRLVYFSGNFATIAAYKAARFRDSFSIKVNPLFASQTDLHVNNASLDSSGKKLVEVTTDIDGQLRNTVKPDIGADEFSPPHNDLGVTAFISPGAIFPADTMEIEVLVYNFGLDTVTVYDVYAVINSDTLKVLNLVDTIVPGGSSTVKLDSFSFNSSTLYNLTAWTSDPNNTSDDQPSNDTFKIQNRYTALSGVYTIGGTTPDFTNFKAAVEALKFRGMIDSVRFRVRAGTYAEQIRIPAITGAGARNSIIFESENLDSNSVILTYASTYYDTNYTVFLDGADGITFRYLTIRSTGTSYGHVFQYENNANYNGLYHNRIVGPSTTSTSNDRTLVISENYPSNEQYNEFRANHFVNGSMGIFWESDALSPNYYEFGNIIDGNIFDQQYYRGIYMYQQWHMQITNNVIRSSSLHTGYYGIEGYYDYGRSVITGNDIQRSSNGYYGMYLYNLQGSGDTALIANNMINIGGTSSSIGLYLYNPSFVHVINNTLRNGSTSSSSYAFQVNSGSNNWFYNNILVNEGPGYASYVGSTSNITLSDNNNFKTAGTNFVYWNGTYYSTLSALQTASSKDINSLSVNPQFLSSTNLHVKELSLNGAAKPYKRVLTDFDGEARDSVTPDIGADEFNPPPLDAGISDVIIPKIPFPSDSQFVKVVLRNFGSDTLKTVQIKWELNGVSQTTYNWSGNLKTSDTIHVLLSKKFFSRDSSYRIKSWTSLPNSTGDTVNSNDTFFIQNQYTCLGGTYTIGGASPDFATFTDAVNALKRGGICSQVIFNVRNGSYQEQVRIPKILGSDTVNSIIFQSESKDSSKVNLFSNANSFATPYTVRLDSAVGITFRHLTISTLSSSYGRVVEIINGARYIRLTNNLIDGYTTTSTGDYLACIYSYTGGGSNHYNEFTNNLIRKGSIGISHNGSFSGIYDNKLMIKNNIIEKPYYYGIITNYSDSIKIEGNMIEMDANTYTYSYGMQINEARKGFRVYGNRVNLSNSYIGIYISNSDGTSSNRGLFANNMVYVGSNGATNAVQFYETDYADIYHNNLNMVASNTNSYSAYFYYGGNLRVVNNSFRHGGTGYAYYTSSTANITQSDYNCYYSGGTNLAFWGANRTDLAALRTANSKDVKSISVDPDYVTTSDLHVRATDLNEAALLISSITEDFDGEVRDSIKPDIGADEFRIPAKDDAGISEYVGPVAPFAAGSQSVKVKIKNYGSDSLKTATINWKINGTSQSSFSWSGALKTGKDTTVTIGSFTFTAGIQYILEAWTTSPNGQNDTINYNDSLRKDKIYSALDGNYTIGGTLPDFGTFAAAVEAMHLGGVIDTVNFLVRNGTYTEQVLINAYPGSSVTRPVTFTSQSGDSSKVILQFNCDYYNNYLFQLNGADYVTVSKMTLKQLSYYYGFLFIVGNGAVGNTLTNCSLKGYNGYYSSQSRGVYSASDKDDSLTIQNNSFFDLYYGINIFGGGSGVSNYESGLRILNNKMENIYYSGIYLSYFNSPVISSNEIHSLSTYGYEMIIVTRTSDKLVISHNKIFSAYYYCNGIRVENHLGSSTLKGSVFNNFVSLNSISNSSRGISAYSCSYLNIYYNSVNIYGSSIYSYSLYLDGGNNLDIRNNIFSNPSGGYAYYHNAASVSQSDYNNLYTSGTNLGYYGSGNRTNLAAWKSITSKDANSKSVDPIFNSNTDLHTNLINLDSAATPISGITDDIDKDTRNATKPDIGADEFNSLPNNLSVVSIISPVTGCTLDSQIITISINNYGSNGQKNFPVKYSVNGGTVISETNTDSIGPGANANFSFTAKVDMTAYGTYNLVCWTDLSTEQFRYNDTVKGTVINYQLPVAVSSMIPADSTKNLNFPISLSWSPSIGATMYDVYIWPDSVSTRPTSPAYSNLTQISQQIYGLGYGIRYKWQVVSKNTACFTDGPTQVFTVRELPDFVITSVSVPATAFSGNNFSVSWNVKNIGTGPASGSWWDLMYLSSDLVFDGSDIYMGGVQNPAALNPGQSYNQSLSGTLPNGISGTYHIIVRADIYGYQLESDEGNNTKSDTTGMVVSLTPPPDLRVDSITKTATIFSGYPIDINYKVINKGTGNTRTASWYDYIYISKDSIFSGTAEYKASYHRSGTLDPDSFYRVHVSFTIPLTYSGKYYIFVRTDIYNYVFEHTSEGNNTGRSDSLIVKLTPPPDLVVKNVEIEDTASNREVIHVKYQNINQGGSETPNFWYDDIYITPFSTFSTGTATWLGNVYHTYLDQGDTAFVDKTVTIPAAINGDYKMYVITDLNNQLFEGDSNSNNRNGPIPIQIVSPDLVVPYVDIPDTDTSGKKIEVLWRVRNDGPGHGLGGSRRDRIFISGYNQYHKDSVIQIDSLDYLADILKGDSIQKTKECRIPNGYHGNKYVYVTTDALNQIFEKGNDNNNTGGSEAIDVKLQLYPDLRTISVNCPDSTEAGQSLVIDYTVDNRGTMTAIAHWKDRIYVSKDSVFSLAKSVLLSTTTHQESLGLQSSYDNSTMVTLPGTLSAGDYFIYVYTDALDQLYEYTFDTNNIRKSCKFFIDGYPPVDLEIYDLDCKDSVKSGSRINFAWRVRNIGEATTIADFWTDRVYFSVDTLLDSGDRLIGEAQVSDDLDPNEIYRVEQSFNIPNGMSGDYYVLGFTDVANANNDEDTTNNKDVLRKSNGQKRFTNIALTPPPDLQITSWDIPSTGTSGQPIKVKWTVQNKGVGPTVGSSWADYVYLSTDYVVNSGDHLIGTKTHSGALAVNESYIDSGEFFVPSSITGNFIAIIRTDEGNVIYEHTNEGNNNVATVINLSPAPPADLVVSSVSAPAIALAGSSVKVDYQLKNIGSNPATGSLTDNIYISKDSIWDGTDKLFATNAHYISLAPNGTSDFSVTEALTGVPVGKYFFIVVADVRNNITESKDTNNNGYSDVIGISIPTLPLNVLTPDTLWDDKELYYKLIIPGSLFGESILVNLKGDSVNGNNEMYLKFGDVPTRSNFDLGFSRPFYGNQEIIIPSADSGIYYLMAFGNTSIAAYQNVTLLARKLEFEIRRINPVSGGNTGNVTLFVEGSKFDVNTNFRLLLDSQFIGSTPVGYYIDIHPEDAILLIDPIKAYVTFRLFGHPNGRYTIQGIKPTEQCSLTKAFSIVEGLPPDLQVNVVRPSNTRTASIISMVVSFTNEGNTDMKGAILEFNSNAGAPIAFTPEDLTKNYTTLSIVVEEEDGPPGILRPKGSGSVTIYTKATTPLGFNIVLPNF